jgi:hypothetical protein
MDNAIIAFRQSNREIVTFAGRSWPVRRMAQFPGCTKPEWKSCASREEKHIGKLKTLDFRPDAILAIAS